MKNLKLLSLFAFLLLLGVGCADNDKEEGKAQLKLSATPSIVEKACPANAKCGQDVESCKRTLASVDDQLAGKCTEDQLRVVVDCAQRGFQPQCSNQTEQFYNCVKKDVSEGDCLNGLKDGLRDFKSASQQEGGQE